MFSRESYLVNFYVRKVNEGLKKEDVPTLFNLKEVVLSIVG